MRALGWVVLLPARLCPFPGSSLLPSWGGQASVPCRLQGFFRWRLVTGDRQLHHATPYFLLPRPIAPSILMAE